MTSLCVKKRYFLKRTMIPSIQSIQTTDIIDSTLLKYISPWKVELSYLSVQVMLLLLSIAMFDVLSGGV